MKKELKEVLHLYMGCEISAAHISTAILTHKLTNASHIAIDLVLKCEHYKPILRALSDMTNEERREIDEIVKECDNSIRKVDICEGEKWAIMTSYMLQKGFDLFGLIESGQAIDKNKL